MNKKNILTGLAALTLLDVSAEVAQAQSWSGAYVGGHVGYRWGDADLTAPAFSFFIPATASGIFNIPARSESYSPNGVVGGAHIGYNFLIQPNWLLGVEADLTAGSASDSKTANFLSSDSFVAVRTSTVKLGAQGTLRGRVGYTDGPWLLYATGGVAFAQLKWSETFVAPVLSTTLAASSSRTVAGWTVGGGVERALTSYLSVRAQYLYEDFGTRTVPLATAATSQNGRLSVSASKFTVGGSFKF